MGAHEFNHLPMVRNTKDYIEHDDCNSIQYLRSHEFNDISLLQGTPLCSNHICKRHFPGIFIGQPINQRIPYISTYYKMAHIFIPFALTAPPRHLQSRDGSRAMPQAQPVQPSDIAESKNILIVFLNHRK